MYYLLLCFYFLMCIVYDWLRSSNIPFDTNKLIFNFSVLGMGAAVVGFRNLSVGVDTLTYDIIYNDVIGLSWNKILSSYFYLAVEVGYISLMKITSYVVKDYYFFQLIVALWTYYNLSLFLNKFSHYPRLTVLALLATGLFFSSFNITRQIFAVSLLALTFYLLTERRKIYSFIILCFAVTIHMSSVVGLLIIIVWSLRRRPVLMKILPIITLSIPLLGGILLNIFFIMTMEKYGSYMNNSKEIQESNFIRILWLIEIVISLYLIYKTKNNNNKVIANIALLYVVFYILGSQINYAQRIGLFFLPFIYLCIDRFICELSSKRLRVQMMTFFIVTFTLLYCLSSNGTYLEYSTFF